MQSIAASIDHRWRDFDLLSDWERASDVLPISDLPRGMRPWTAPITHFSVDRRGSRGINSLAQGADKTLVRSANIDHEMPPAIYHCATASSAHREKFHFTRKCFTIAIQKGSAPRRNRPSAVGLRHSWTPAGSRSARWRSQEAARPGR